MLKPAMKVQGFVLIRNKRNTLLCLWLLLVFRLCYRYY